MLNIKFLNIISTFTDEEFYRFQSLINANFTNTGRNYSAILEHLYFLHKNNYFNRNQKECLTYLRTNMNISQQSLLTRFSELYKTVKFFLACIQLYKNNNQTILSFLQVLLDKKAYKLFDITYKEFEKFLLDQPVSSDNLQSLEKFYNLCSNYAFLISDLKKYLEFFKTKNILSTYIFLNNYMFSFIEAVQIEINGNGNYYPLTKLPDENFDNVFKSLHFINYDLMLSATYYFYKSFSDFSNTDYYYKASEIHKKVLPYASRELNIIFYSFRINYCINQSNLKKFVFKKEMFNVIKEKLANNYFDELSIINFPINNFRDYVFIALSLNEINWVKTFISDYSKYLPEEVKENEINISTALILMEEKKYSESLGHLHKTRKSNYIHYLDAGIYTIRCLYKLSLYVEALDEIKKIKNYITYHKNIPELHSKNILKSMEDITYLIRYKLNIISIKDLKYYFRNKETFVSSRWLKDELSLLGL